MINSACDEVMPEELEKLGTSSDHDKEHKKLDKAIKNAKDNDLGKSLTG